MYIYTLKTSFPEKESPFDFSPGTSPCQRSRLSAREVRINDLAAPPEALDPL